MKTIHKTLIMKYPLFIIVFYATLNSSITAQSLANPEEDIQHGAVGIGTTIVQKTSVGLGQERIAYIKAKYIEQQSALKTAIKEGETTVLKAKEKINLAKERLEREWKENKISERVYIARKERLEMIEQKTKDLENTLLKN